MGEVVPARTSPTLLPPSPRTVLSLSCFKVSQWINCHASTLRVRLSVSFQYHAYGLFFSWIVVKLMSNLVFEHLHLWFIIHTVECEIHSILYILSYSSFFFCFRILVTTTLSQQDCALQDQAQWFPTAASPPSWMLLLRQPKPHFHHQQHLSHQLESVSSLASIRHLGHALTEYYTVRELPVSRGVTIIWKAAAPPASPPSWTHHLRNPNPHFHHQQHLSHQLESVSNLASTRHLSHALTEYRTVQELPASRGVAIIWKAAARPASPPSWTHHLRNPNPHFPNQQHLSHQLESVSGLASTHHLIHALTEYRIVQELPASRGVTIIWKAAAPPASSPSLMHRLKVPKPHLLQQHHLSQQLESVSSLTSTRHRSHVLTVQELAASGTAEVPHASAAAAH